jgi:hypothetical protein
MTLAAFLLAANVVLEISGETSDVKSFFNSSSASGAAAAGAVSYGCFHMSAGAAASAASASNTHSSTTCETTANGCRCVVLPRNFIN